MVVAISTGCCFDLDLNQLESIHWLERFKGLIDGVELLFAFPNELLEFNFDERALSFLKELDFVSIHMPFKEIEYGKSAETRRLLSKAGAVAKKAGVQYIVFHPNNVKEFTALKASVPVCIENMNPKPENSGFRTVEEISKILSKNSFLNLVLDVEHAIGSGIRPKDFLILSNKLKAIHVSVPWQRNGKPKGHGFVSEFGQKFLPQLKEVLPFSVPKVLETDFYPEKVPLIEKEIKLLKQLSGCSQ